jgi:hypothetical protein
VGGREGEAVSGYDIGQKKLLIKPKIVHPLRFYPNDMNPPPPKGFWQESELPSGFLTVCTYGQFLISKKLWFGSTSFNCKTWLLMMNRIVLAFVGKKRVKASSGSGKT